MIFTRSLSIFLLLYTLISAKSYEGYIRKTGGTLLPIWVELTTDSTAITGSYFYRKFGTPIKLTGLTEGNRFTLTETLNGKTNGIWNCTDYTDSITGIWHISKKKPLTIKLFPADSADRKFAKLDWGKLKLAKDSYWELPTLESEINFGRDHYGDGRDMTIPIPVLQYCRKNLISVTTDYWFMGAYPTESNWAHVFDLTTGNEISFWNEIDHSQRKAIKQLLSKRIQPIVVKERKEQEKYFNSTNPHSTNPKADWEDELLRYVCNSSGTDEEIATRLGIDISDEEYLTDSDRLRDGLKIDPTQSSSFYITEHSVQFRITNYYRLPHVSQYYDFSCEIPLSFKELMPYLKPNSPLRRLVR